MSPVFPNQNSIDRKTHQSQVGGKPLEVVQSKSYETKTVPLAGKSYRWNQRKYSRTRRRIDIWLFAFTFLFRNWYNDRKWSYVGGYTPEKQAVRRRSQAIWIRENFLELGPTFIKLGQLFSTRADLSPLSM